MTAKEYFREEISGEPLTEEWVIYHLKKFTMIKLKEQRENCSRVDTDLCYQTMKCDDLSDYQRLIIMNAKKPKL
jgi:hypothetical protein